MAYNGTPVIGVTPAGRRRYLEILVPHLLAQRPVLDEHYFWLNTSDMNDIAYIVELCRTYPDFFRFTPLPEGVKHNPSDGNSTIHKFFPQFCEPGKLYVRFDDDVCWIEPGAVERLAAYHTAHPEHFLVYGNIVNNAVVSYLHQQHGILPIDKGEVTKECLCPVGWVSGEFAAYVHERFLEALEAGELTKYHMPTEVLLPALRVSINCVMWRGERFAQFGGKVTRAEEQCISEVMPNYLGLSTAIVGDALVSHFAFGTQRYHLEEHTDLLDRYKALADAISPSPSAV